MSEQTMTQLYSELHQIQETLRHLESQIAQLLNLFPVQESAPTREDFMSIVALGNSGLSDISENHDYYVGEAIAHEDLR